MDSFFFTQTQKQNKNSAHVTNMMQSENFMESNSTILCINCAEKLDNILDQIECKTSANISHDIKSSLYRSEKFCCGNPTGKMRKFDTATTLEVDWSTDSTDRFAIPQGSLVNKFFRNENDISTTTKKVSIKKLWRYSGRLDLFLIFIGSLFSIVTGSGLPLVAAVFGGTSDSFMKMTQLLKAPDSPACDKCNFTISDIYSREQFHDDVIHQCILYTVIGAGVYLAAFFQASCFLIAGEQLIYNIRLAFFRGILHQDITWFDKNNTGTLATKLFDNLERVKEGTGDKVGLLIQFISQFVTGYVIAFTYDWKMTLIMISFAPFIMISGLFMAKFMESASQAESQGYAKAGAIAEQALGSIRTVVAFNGISYECDRYDAALNECKKNGIKKNIYMGIALGTTFFILFASYFFAFWFGTNFVVNGTLTAKKLLTVFFSVLLGSIALGQAGQQLGTIGTAQGAAAAIFEIIDRNPEIDSYSSEGERLISIDGAITVENVKFSYPTRKEIQICKGISFNAEPGQTVALVGSSGCGKSTIIQLLLRYYNPDSGRLLIDGIEISKINIECLRKIIGVVSQEPILFNCSIEENILYGNENITMEEMIKACKIANIDGFISKLPHGYKTIVGERGTQLSGGQKQRIAIARALIRNPKILLLDEATSALDAESESIVQLALDKARQGRTTIVVAHRLSTIRNADKIIAMKNGQIYEIGTHDELMERKGLYFKLVSAQAFVDVEKHEEIKRRFSHISHRSRTSSMLSNRRSSVTFSIDSFVPVAEDDEKSVTKRLMKDLEAEGAKEANLFTILLRARQWWGILFIAIIASIVNGAIFPGMSIIFIQLITDFSTSDVHQIKKDGHFWSLMFLACGIAQGISVFFQSALMGYVAEELTTKFRSNLFCNVLRMDIGYFDKDIHSSGKISTRLATDAPNVKSAIDYRLGTVISALMSILFGLGISFYYSWAMTLLVFGIFPLVIIGRALQLKYLKGSGEKDARDMENAGNIAMQGIENVRTVQALTLEQKFYIMFKTHLSGPHKSARKDAITQGFTYGFSSGILFFILAACFRFALWLVLHHGLKPMNVLNVLMAISFSFQNIGFAAAYFPEYKRAKLAAGIIFKMLNEVPQIDSLSNHGIKKDFNGNVHFKQLKFSYPERQTVPILKGLDISIKQGETLALVGPSGCGKSTLVLLLERFYDPNSGIVELDGIDLKQRNIGHVRSNMGLVSQEPTLFDCSIRENLIYGMDRKTVTDEDILKVAQMANIHNFVQNLPAGYSTRVGEKGTQLSGGQKQRIAIARALIRNPKILLLDEATSALDTESEKIVQEALDKAREGRTCIVIAHRLSTIINADCIAVCNNGIVVEKGTHAELMELKGAYYNLTQKQLLMKKD